jgi:hypothetical protein
MGKLVEFPLSDEGGVVWVEVDEKQPTRGMRPAARGEDEGVAVRARDTFDQALATFRPAARAIIRTLADLTPEELEITLGIKFSVDARAFIAATSAEASIGVKITWKKLPEDPKTNGT